jgi:hypothetical protein
MAETNAGHGQVMPDIGGWISGPMASVGSIALRPCPLRDGFLQLADDRHPDEVFHVRADEFAAFALMVKGGVYDHLLGSQTATKPDGST